MSYKAPCKDGRSNRVEMRLAVLPVETYSMTTSVVGMLRVDKVASHIHYAELAAQIAGEPALHCTSPIIFVACADSHWLIMSACFSLPLLVSNFSEASHIYKS